MHRSVTFSPTLPRSMDRRRPALVAVRVAPRRRDDDRHGRSRLRLSRPRRDSATATVPSAARRRPASPRPLTLSLSLLELGQRVHLGQPDDLGTFDLDRLGVHLAGLGLVARQERAPRWSWGSTRSPRRRVSVQTLDRWSDPSGRSKSLRRRPSSACFMNRAQICAGNEPPVTLPPMDGRHLSLRIGIAHPHRGRPGRACSPRTMHHGTAGSCRSCRPPGGRSAPRCRSRA